MALIHSKQLNPKLTGSFILSGSQQDFLGTTGISFTGPSKFIGHITGSDNRHISMSYNSTGSFGDVEVGGDLSVTEYIRHKGDVNTAIRFTDNKISLDAGGMTFFAVHDDDSAPFTATVNGGGNKINFRALDENQAVLLKTDSEAFNVGLYHAGNKKLETAVGGVDITGHVTASGNISGSATSTGSFGLVQVHAIAGNSPINFTDTIIESQNLEVVGHITASGNISNVSTTHVTASGNVDVGGDLNVSQYIYHKNDPNTYLNFTDDRLRFNIGGISYLDFNDSTAAPHDITFNDGANNVDVTIKGSSNNPLFKTDASAGRIGTNGIGTPLAGLHIGDNLKVNSHITASANISASGNLDVGGKIYSIGDIETKGDIIAQQFIVSSSVTYMTQSFSSGSTIFGDSNDDTHQMTGSLLNKGSITTTGAITATGNIITQGSITAGQGQVFGSTSNDKHEFTGSVVITGSLNTESGRIFEQGTSVIDHATAMAIVFGG